MRLSEEQQRLLTQLDLQGPQEQAAARRVESLKERVASWQTKLAHAEHDLTAKNG